MAKALRVGLLVPANNTTMARELPQWMPPGTTCTTLLIPRQKGLLTLADIPAYVDKAIEMAQSLRDDKVDVVVYGCTAAGILAGPERDAAIAASLERVVGRPTVTTAGSMNASMQNSGVRNIALVTPYADAVNENLKRFLAAVGVSVQTLSSFAVADVDALGRITGNEVEARAQAVMTNRCDGMFIACSQLPTFGVVERLQERFKRPVMSSIKATALRATRAIEAVPSA
jgi:maleate cis-trans isomerase